MEQFSGLCLFVCALIAVTAGNTVDYCKVRSCGTSHTMCKYGSNPAPQCYNVQEVGLTPTEKRQVLRKHNALRAKVARGEEERGAPGPQPAAANIGPLKWNKELAAIAQQWANQCMYGHDKCRNVARFHVGQNVAISKTTGPNNGNLVKMVQLWYDEVQDFDKNQVTNFSGGLSSTGKKIGHYTQMVWAETTVVGCGSIRYQEPKWNTTYFVCNYGPAGNWLGEPLYKIV